MDVPQATLDHPKPVGAFPVLGSSCDIEMGRLHAAFEAFKGGGGGGCRCHAPAFSTTSCLYKPREASAWDGISPSYGDVHAVILAWGSWRRCEVFSVGLTSKQNARSFQWVVPLSEDAKKISPS